MPLVRSLECYSKVKDLVVAIRYFYHMPKRSVVWDLRRGMGQKWRGGEGRNIRRLE